MTITFRGIEFANGWEALQYADLEGGKPIRIAGRHFVVAMEEAERLDADGVSFAFVSEHATRDGTPRLMTVPLN